MDPSSLLCSVCAGARVGRMVTQTFGYGLVRISPRGVRCVRLLRGSPLLTRRLELRAGRATAPSGVGGASVSQLGLDSAHTAPRRKASGVPWHVLSSATARCAAGPEPYFIRTENGVSLGRLRKQSALCSSIPNARAVTFVSHSLSLHHCKLLASGCGTLARAARARRRGLDHLRASVRSDVGLPG